MKPKNFPDILFDILHLKIYITDGARKKTPEYFKDGQTVAAYLKTGRPTYLREFMKDGSIIVE